MSHRKHISLLASLYHDPVSPPTQVAATFLSAESGGLHLNLQHESRPGAPPPITRLYLTPAQANFLASFLGAFDWAGPPTIGHTDNPALDACRYFDLWVREHSNHLAYMVGGEYESDFLSRAIDLSRQALEKAESRLATEIAT